MEEAEEYKILNIDNVLYGPECNEKMPQGGLGQYIIKQCEKYADQIMQSCPYENRSITFAQFKMRSLNLAENMKLTYGIKKGDVIMSCMKNSLENAIPASATWLLSGITCTLDPTFSARDSEYLIKLVQPKIIILDEESLPTIETILKNIHLEAFLFVNGNGNENLNYPLLNDLIHVNTNANKLDFVPEDVDESTPAVVLFSSGTTGMPKGICHSHKSVYLSVFGYLESFGMMPKCILHYSTLYWTSALSLFLSQFYDGAKRIAMRHCDALFNCQTISKYSVDSIFMATSYSNILLDMKRYENQYDLTSLKYFLVGGTPLPKDLCQRVFNAFPNIFFVNGYGLTETSCVSTYYKEFRDKLLTKPSSCGKIARGAVLKIIDPETGKILGPNQRGEIYVKSKSIMLGYYNNTSDIPFDPEGFVQSGDVAHYDEDYFLYVYDRVKEMFKYQSWHIVPVSIETIIQEHPAVNEAVVFGIPHERDGFLPSAAVTLKTNFKSTKQVTAEEIADFVAGQVADRQKLRGGVYIINQLEKTPTGKIQRKKVQEYIMQHLKTEEI